MNPPELFKNSPCRNIPKETQTGSSPSLTPAVLLSVLPHQRCSAAADAACKGKPASLAASSRDLPWQPESVISAAPGEVERRVGRALQNLLSLSAARLQTSTPTPSGDDPAGSPPAAALRPGCLCGLFFKKKKVPAKSHESP